jgi:flagellar protein FliJ
MAKFKFRLESVLKLKEEQKKQTEMELAGIRHKKVETEDEMQSLIKEKSYIWQTINDKKNRQVLDFQADYYYMDALEKSIVNYKHKLTRIQNVENKVVSEIVTLDKERKTMEKLKEKKKVEFIKESNRTEQNLLDDLSQRIKSKA